MKQSEWELLTLELQSNRQQEEFVKKYRGTWLWVAGELAYFNEFDGKYYYFNQDSPNPIRVVHNTEVTIEARFPATGLFSHNGLLMLCSRVPARQYRKAPCKDNCVLSSVLHRNWALNRDQPSFSPETLASAFSPIFFDYDVALEMLQKETWFLGGALSPNFGMLVNPTSEDKALLTYRDSIIGYCTDKKIIVVSPVFKQEVSDFVRDNGIKVVVE